MREQSRQKYLAKREESELRKLELKIFDEERLFKGEELSAEERRRLEIDKELLHIAKKRRKLRHEETAISSQVVRMTRHLTSLRPTIGKSQVKKTLKMMPTCFCQKMV